MSRIYFFIFGDAEKLCVMLAFFRGKWYIIDANWGMHSRMHTWESRETGSLFVVCAPRARSNGWRRQSLRHLVSVHNEYRSQSVRYLVHGL